MKNLKTLTAVMNNGRIVTNLPEYSDGTKLKLGILSAKEALQKS